MSTACLLIHGFCGSPFEVAPLTQGLQDLGCYVEAPVLPGHGTTIEDIKPTRFNDWLSFCDQRLTYLLQHYTKVIVVGFSFGGTIALTLACKYSLSGVIAISAPCRSFRLFPLEMRDYRIIFAQLAQYITPYVPYRTATKASKAISPFEGYEGVLCLPQLASMQKAFYALRPKLCNITCPALIVHDLHDKVVFPSNALEIARKISSQTTRLVYTCCQETITSHHHITTHKEVKDQVIAEVNAFVAQHMKNEIS